MVFGMDTIQNMTITVKSMMGNIIIKTRKIQNGPNPAPGNITNINRHIHHQKKKKVVLEDMEQKSIKRVNRQNGQSHTIRKRVNGQNHMIPKRIRGVAQSRMMIKQIIDDLVDTKQ